MPNSAQEKPLPLVVAIEKATGFRPHISTALRWCNSTNRFGVRLESWRVNNRHMTSIEAVHRYNERTTAAANAAKGIPSSASAQRSSAHAIAQAELDREFGPSSVATA